MKFLLDFLPIVLFFITFKYAESHQDWAASHASDWFGFLISGGHVAPDQAPVLLATVVVILATVAQVIYMMVTRKKIDTMLWVSLALVVVFGGATIWFHNDTFIKWKPSVLYWLMGIALAVGHFVMKKNILLPLMGGQIQLKDTIWRHLHAAWVGFFMVMGVINIWIAYHFPTSVWVDFKLFGSMGLMIVFVIGQAIYLNRHLK